jgi:hypothetical protein
MSQTFPHDVVHAVLETFKGLPERLSAITGKSAEIYRSHGRMPKTIDPIASGNVSPVTHLMTYARLLEAAMPGAGRMLISRLFAALDTEFREITNKTQSEIHLHIEDESCDVRKSLARKNLDKCTPSELRTFEAECDEAIEAFQDAKSKARSLRLQAKCNGKAANVKGVM